MRNELAHNRDFDPRALFERIETFRNGTISANELLIFLQDHAVKTINEEECKEIIAEFDSNQDGTMGYDEMLNCLLPATNPALRDFCLYGYKVPSRYVDRGQPLPVGITTTVIRIFEKEKKLHVQRKCFLSSYLLTCLFLSRLLIKYEIDIHVRYGTYNLQYNFFLSELPISTFYSKQFYQKQVRKFELQDISVEEKTHH